MDSKFYFKGLVIDQFPLLESLEAVQKRSETEPVKVFWVNAHSINVSEENPKFKEALQEATFLFNDGAGIEIAAFLLNSPSKTNLNGTDWIPAFLDSLTINNTNATLFLLGADQTVIKKAAEACKKNWSKLNLVGFHHGYFKDPETVLQEIESTRPSILLVGMGVPLQELFIVDHWERIKKAGVRIAIAGGAVFDFMSGTKPRAPLWLRKLRLEWLFRLSVEPSRLTKRYLIGNPKFLWLVIKEWFNK